jgi:hypothetical protein
MHAKFDEQITKGAQWALPILQEKTKTLLKIEKSGTYRLEAL